MEERISLGEGRKAEGSGEECGSEAEDEERNKEKGGERREKG